jgi:hypothetical protein
MTIARSLHSSLLNLDTLKLEVRADATRLPDGAAPRLNRKASLPMPSNEPSDLPLQPSELFMLMAVRDVWCEAKGIEETRGAYQQVLLDLIDGYQSGMRTTDQMVVRLQLLGAAGRHG